MKAMWSAASGMKSLQTKIDTISNNISNVNTVGFKGQRIEFKDLMYERVSKEKFVQIDGNTSNIEIGHGVMVVGTTRDFSSGSFQQTDKELDMAVNGDGFFSIQNQYGEEVYTKDGTFKLSIQDGEASLVTTGGYSVLGEDGPIELGDNINEIKVAESGLITVERNDGTKEEVGTLKLVSFSNPAGLSSNGKNLYTATDISGDPLENIEGSAGEVWQGYVESSNIEVVKEMVDMISAQRAYELNSKTIQTVDNMLQVANNIKR